VIEHAREFAVQPVLNLMRQTWQCLLVLVGLWTGLGGAFAGSATNLLVWSSSGDHVTADVRGWPLLTLLESIAAQSGWQVRIEPDLEQLASVKFKNLPSGEALRFLLGDLNYALVPQTNGATRLYVFRTALGRATKLVRPPADPAAATAPKRVPNELIIRVKPGTDIAALAKSLGAKIVGRIPELNAYRLQFADEAATEAARQQLQVNPDVASVENNYYLEKPFTPQNLAGQPAPQPKLSLSPVPRETGRVVVGLVDTTLQKQDPALEQFVKERLSLAGEPSGDGVSPTHADAMLNTLVQALAQSLGKSETSVQIIHVDVFGKSATANTFTAAQGMYEAYRHGATVINDSFGSYGESPIMSEVVKFLSGENVPVFAAVGNDGSSTPFTPASIPGVVAVTATERGQVAAYANVGTTPTVAAPGVVIFYYQGMTYGSRGTSVSSAAATGFAAGLADSTGAPWSKVVSLVQMKLPVPAP